MSNIKRCAVCKRMTRTNDAMCSACMREEEERDIATYKALFIVAAIAFGLVLFFMDNEFIWW